MKPENSQPSAAALPQASAGSRLRLLAAAATLALALGLACATVLPGFAQTALPGIPGADLFTNGPLLRLTIQVPSDGVERLRQRGRETVRATVTEAGGALHDAVRLRLKGSRGSYRSVDDKPAFTLQFGDAAGGGRFHGLSKIHLNNSVEDPAYFNEHAGSVLFRAAGIPAPRVTHALVHFNGRRLGLYVLKEGFAPEFLEQHFPNPRGNLYDTDPGYDVDEALTKETGDGPDDGGDLRALAEAAREPDPAARWERLGRVLDRERFVTFLALEILVGHRDGYGLARNNFRVFQELDSGHLVFLPHGMDQLFGRPDATIWPVCQGLVARAVLDTPAGRAEYRERLEALAGNTLDVARLRRDAAELWLRVGPALEPDERAAWKQALDAAESRIAQRAQSVRAQLQTPEPRPLHFTNGVTRLAGAAWRAVDVPDGGALDRASGPDGRPALHLVAGPRTAASWRTEVFLEPGRYRFRAVVATRGVVPLLFGKNHGAGLRVGGSEGALEGAGIPAEATSRTGPGYELTGDHAAREVAVVFGVPTPREIELMCELRAQAGEAWFGIETLTIEVVR